MVAVEGIFNVINAVWFSVYGGKILLFLILQKFNDLPKIVKTTILKVILDYHFELFLFHNYN